ncbi:MAG: spermidine/putrescine ABC transporter permease PotC [Gammaproteobacteria bacterium RIFCSPHIGHO2_12_FULL_35_23]|nr:MAG: spermidine/putrescine ABC transporter permease PotC [Gammaproteobacteria bacterium RIFCSPHIGHO2_12_FULL_35_23]
MNKSLSASYLAFIYVILYLPILVLIVFSFNNSMFSGLWHGATLKWYRELFHDSGLQVIAIHSLIISFLASTVATFIGLLGAVALFKYQFFGKKLLNGVVFIMIVIPDLVLGIAFLILFHALNISLGFWTLLLAHITFCIPFVVVTILSRITGTDKNLFEAAKDLGANDFIVFSKIIVPMLIPGIVAAWLLSFTLSFDDVVISTFVSGPDFQILPLYIFSQVKLGVTPELNALCSVILLLTVVMALIAQMVLKKK